METTEPSELAKRIAEAIHEETKPITSWFVHDRRVTAAAAIIAEHIAPLEAERDATAAQLSGLQRDFRSLSESCSQYALDLAASQAECERLRGDGPVAKWNCAALKQGTAGGNEPAECTFPFCGCDPRAADVVEAMKESGWISPEELCREREMAAHCFLLEDDPPEQHGKPIACTQCWNALSELHRAAEADNAALRTQVEGLQTERSLLRNSLSSSLRYVSEWQDQHGDSASGAVLENGRSAMSFSP